MYDFEVQKEAAAQHPTGHEITESFMHTSRVGERWRGVARACSSFACFN